MLSLTIIVSYFVQQEYKPIQMRLLLHLFYLYYLVLCQLLMHSI